MANTAITGFIPVRVIGGGTVTYQKRRVLTNNGTAIFQYDALKVTAAGDYLVASATNTAIASVSMGCVFTDTNNIRREAKFLPAATTYSGSTVDPANASYLYVVENELLVEFRCSVNAAIALTDLDNNYAMVLGAGSTTTGLSGHTLDTAGHGTGNTLPWRVTLPILGNADNDPDATNPAVIARINRSLTETALSDGSGT